MHHSIRTLLAIVGLVCFQAQPSLAIDTSVGRSDVTTHTGSFNYSIPIKVPPGVGGLQPSLSLDYSSSRGNGLYGLGWNLNIGCIERGTKDGVPNYDGRDTFLLNLSGASHTLVEVSPGEYRVRSEGAFLKILKVGNYWEVKDKAGTSYYFGLNDSGQQSAWPGGEPNAFRWRLSKVADVNGNEMNFYYVDGGNGHRIDRIAYAPNNEVRFTYDFTRVDKPINMRSGFKENAKALLRVVESYANTQVIFHLDVAYGQSPSDIRSLLTTATVVPQGSQSGPLVMTFQYDSGATGFDSSPIIWNDDPGHANWESWVTNDANHDGWSHGTYRAILDIDGNGLPDRVTNNDQATSLKVYLNNGSGFEPTPIIWNDDPGHANWESWVTNDSNHDGWSHGTYRAILDINGDGLPDRITNNDQATSLKVYLNQFRPPLMTAIIASNGARSSVEYQSSRKFDNTTLGGKLGLPFNVWVVSKVTTSGPSVEMRSVSYDYQGGLFQKDVKEFRGFRIVAQADDQTGIVTETEYHQDIVFQGRPKFTETRLADGTAISRTDNTWLAKEYDGGLRHFPYVKQSDSKTYELDGSLVTHQTSDATYDDFGNPIQATVDFQDGHTKTTINIFSNDTANWIPGKLTHAEVTAATPGQPVQTRASAFTYDALGRLTSEIIEPDNPALSLTTSYTYDGYGNRLTTTVTGSGIASRTTTVAYDANGQFPVSTTNALGHAESYVYDPRWGVMTSLSGPNLLTTSWEYDGFGRQVKETRADGTYTETAYNFVTAPFFVKAESFGSNGVLASPPVTTYYDVLGRETQKETVGFSGQPVYVNTTYDGLGRVASKSRPYAEGTPSYEMAYTSYAYDNIGRAVSMTAPDGSVSQTAYDGLTTTSTNPLGQTRSEIKNSQGQLVQVIDAMGGSMSYEYDTFGNLTQTVDALNNITTMAYDIRGRKTAMSDPDMGNWTYTYDPVGNLISQTDAKAQTTVMVYDMLNRMVSRFEAEGVSTWVYDSSPGKGVGKLAMSTAPNGSSKNYTYDDFGRSTWTNTRVSGVDYLTYTSYDPASRVSKIQYPTGVTVIHGYTISGHFKEVRNFDTGVVYWRADVVDAEGRVLDETLGNGLTTHRQFNPLTGALGVIATGTGLGASEAQNFQYVHDSLGNQLSRTDHNMGFTESFAYDQINRLTGVSGPSAKSYVYDAIGNITYKSDVGAYAYGAGNAGPHAVTSAGGNTYAYDANGNMTSGGGRTMSWTSFNKPSQVQTATATTVYGYDANHNRLTKYTGATTTTYIGKLYERVNEGGVIKHKHYVYAGGRLISTVEQVGAVELTKYMHADHLGSITAITDESGNVLERLSFDAFGKPRHPDGTGATGLASTQTSRGYTGHEMDAESGLINMNARLYDPVLGRFLSADTIVPNPGDMQGFNRYSYVINNPLKYVDPDGHGWWISVKKWFKK
ncbi:MAG: SpvB/TcaC N-terminal domain-containing protein, partial [Mariprofundaceae bacterium]